MPLEGFSSLCEIRQRIIVSKDDGTSRKHRAVNSGRCNVSHYQIDGNVIKGPTIRCDYLVMNDAKMVAYLIELKGSDIEHAIDQLQTTAGLLHSHLCNYDIKYRIVCSRANTHALKSNKYKKFERTHSKNNGFICKENELEETI